MIRRYLIATTASLVVAFALVRGCAPIPAHAINISQPSSSTLQGAQICSSTPIAGSLLGFGSSQWCDSQNSPQNFILKGPANSNPVLTLTPGQAGGVAVLGTGIAEFEESGDADPRLEENPGTGLQIGAGSASPTTVINESGAVKSGITAVNCTPSGDTALSANTLTTVCTGSTGTLPSSVSGSWLIQYSAMALVTSSTSGTNCVIELTVGSGISVSAESTISGASAFEQLATGTTQVVAANTSLTITLSAECNNAATAKQKDSIVSAFATKAEVLIIPQ